MTTITHSRYWQPTGVTVVDTCGCVWGQYLEEGTADYHEMWEPTHPCPAHRVGCAS